MVQTHWDWIWSKLLSVPVPAGEIYQETDVVDPGAGAVWGHWEGEGGGCPPEITKYLIYHTDEQEALENKFIFFLALYWFLIYQFFLFNNLNFNMLFLYIHSYIGIYQQKLTFFLTLSLRVALFHLLVSSRRWSFEVQNLIKILKYCNINILTSQFCGFFKILSRLKFISLCCIFLYLNWKGKQMKLTSKFHTYTCR